MSKDLPSIPEAGLNPDVRRFLVRVREELQGLMGTRGNDPAARLRQLTGAGAGGDVLVVLPGTGAGGGGDAPDLTPPPTPTFGAGDAFGGIAQLIVTWAGIGYPQGHGNKQTVVYGVKKDPADPTMPTFPGDAGIVAIAPHALTIIAIPSEPNIRWHLWLKFESVDGVLSTTPAGGANGVQATTGQDPASLLAVLTGQIRESHLYRALGAPIRSIIERSDAAAEDTVATLVATHEAGRRARTALLAEAAARGTAITQVRQVVATGDAQLASQITTLTATVDTDRGDRIAAIELEAEARADGDDAEATQRGILATQLRGGYTGTDLASVTSGLVFSERQARSAVDTAHAGRLDSLESSVNNPSTGVAATAAALDAVETLVNDGANGVTALATRTSTLEARVTTPSAVPGNPAFNTTYAALVAEASARATLDGNVRALYTVRAEVSAGGSTVVGGFGLAGTAGGAEGPRIDFGVRADTFFVEAPSGGSNPTTKLTPFTIRTSTFTEGGVSMPAGVYMDAAYVVNLTALYARIATLVADQIVASSISVAKLTAGSIAVGAYIQTTDYLSGTSGWRIHGDGTAEFSGVIVRGTIYAGAGQIGGNTIDSTGVQSPGYTAGSTGWRLDSSGLVRAFASGGARVLDMAATGTQPVLKIGSALELLANGDAYFGGRLAVGSVSANVATGGGYSFPSLPNSTAAYNTGTVVSASLTASGGNVSALVKCGVSARAESSDVDEIRIIAYLHRNSVEVDRSEVFLRACVWPGPTGTTREVSVDMMLMAPLEPLTGLQNYAVSFSVRFYNSAAVAVSPGPSAFTSIFQTNIRLNLQEIKV